MLQPSSLGRVVLLAIAIGALAASPADARRGGTLRVDLRSDFDFIDPALAYFSHSWQLGFMTEAKLLNFPDREANRGGVRIVKEVADSVFVSRDRKTYTINLRKTFRFHTGAPITAHNFVAAFNRNAHPRMNSPATTFMTDIVGANAVIQGRARRISGVRALGRHRLRIRLTRNAPDLLARLTMPFFSAIPLNTPIVPGGVQAPAGFGGPYYVQQWDKGRTAVLVRNRFYRGPRPSNPDRIVYNIGIALDAQALRAERNETDVVQPYHTFPSQHAEELAARYGVNRGRFFVKGQAVFWYLNFNHDEPLFRGNDRLKQAVNHAIDRPQMVRQHGALGGARTDQILPIDFPGFRNWNLYSLRGSNLDRARQLATPEARRGGVVRLAVPQEELGLRIAEVVAFNLRQIGLDTQVNPVPQREYFQFILHNDAWDMSLGVTDPPFFDPVAPFLLSVTPGSASGFDEPAWLRRIGAASRLFGASRARAFSALDRDLMRGPAPVAPYVNTNAHIFVSPRVRNYIFHKVYGTDFAALNLVG